MRVDLQYRLSSTRPTRGALVATLFGVVTLALVVSFSLLPETDDVAAIEASGGDTSDDTAEDTADAASALDDGAEDQARYGAEDDADVGTDSITGATAPAAESVSQPMRYELAMSALAVHDALTPTEQPEAEAPSAPTTAPPTTAAPTTTVVEETTTSDSTDPAETTTTVADGSDTSDTTAPDGTPSSESTETTVEETTTTAHPDGWVDAGHGVFVPPILLSIRYCESRDDYTAANPSSSARGAYQFLTGSWEAYGHAARYGVAQAHLATPAQQDEAALITWQQDGTRPWNASISCWG